MKNFSKKPDIKDYNFKKLPKVFLNGEEYKGKAAFIHGYNGYEKDEDDSILCAIINNSAWNSDIQPNYLKDEDGNLIHSENRRGMIVDII